MSNPFAYFSINDYGAWEETSDPTAHALYEHPDPRVAELEAVLRECRKELNGVLNGICSRACYQEWQRCKPKAIPKGGIPWNKGRPWTEAERQKISEGKRHAV